MASARKLPSSAYAGVNVGFKETEIALQVGEKISNFKLPKTNDLIAWFEEIASKNKIKVIAAALHGEGDLKELGSKLWLKRDIVPLVINNNLDKGTKDLAKLALNQFVDDIAKIKLGPDNKVEVTDLVTLDDYKKITSKGDFELLLKFGEKFKKKRIVFFSATPRGGGVALMRHALIRLFRLVGVDASWHVMEESPEVFEITKKKFHNVLHGIAPKGVKLTERDKKIYNSWIKENAERLHSLFHDSQVIVVDDPQPSGLVPFIRKASPKKKIIYRSHIQLQTSLFDNPKNPQVSVSVKFRGDRRALIINFSNLGIASSASYNLSYNTRGTTQGAGGTIASGAAEPVVRELLFGTCSAGVCRYDTGITNARFTVTTVLKNGLKVIKPFRLKI